MYTGSFKGKLFATQALGLRMYVARTNQYTCILAFSLQSHLSLSSKQFTFKLTRCKSFHI